jgi:hypothetical protein
VSLSTIGGVPGTRASQEGLGLRSERPEISRRECIWAGMIGDLPVRAIKVLVR